MPYTHEYTEGLKQFGVIHLMLKLIDSDGILPEVLLPIVISDNEYTEENLITIANQLIDSYTNPHSITQEETVILEETLEITENNLSE